MDTSADYMSVICDYVTKENTDVYKVIYDDYIEFTKTKEFLNDGFDAGLWAYERYDIMDEDFKNKIISKYGILKVVKSLESVSWVHGYVSVDAFLKEEAADEILRGIIVNIINDEVLMDFRK